MNSHLGDRVLPEILYHYTSQTGLKGMLNKKAIWASKIHYLNDSKEFAPALDLARCELTERIKASTSPVDRSRLELLRDTIDTTYTIEYTIEGVNTCVCCFSELEDDLSQWRGYGGGSAGFSVGFTREWFTRVKETLGETLGLSLRRCIYDPEKQQRLIQDEIDKFLATNADKEPDYWDRNRGYWEPDRPRTYMVLPHAGEDFATRLSLIAPRIKHESFKDEREWRLVAARVSAHELHHRPGRSMLIPYYKIPIGDDDKFDSIREIVVGPTPHLDLSRASVESLANAAGLDNPDNTLTKPTSIPFRNW
jgi:Protein of unknown function (DUF2971)